jgi:hypothetical protein
MWQPSSQHHMYPTHKNLVTRPQTLLLLLLLLLNRAAPAA